MMAVKHVYIESLRLADKCPSSLIGEPFYLGDSMKHIVTLE